MAFHNFKKWTEHKDFGWRAFVVMTSQAYGIKEPGNKDFMPAILDTSQTTKSNCTFNLPSAGQTLEEKL